MIEGVTIVTKGGLVLWNNTTYPLIGNPINALIKNVLLEDRLSEKSFNIDKYTLKWTLENDFNLIFVVVYQKLIQLLYVDELLEILKQKFVEMFRDALEQTKKSSIVASAISNQKFDDFDVEYKRILKAVEQRDRENRALKKLGVFQKQAVSERLRSEKQIEKDASKKQNSSAASGGSGNVSDDSSDDSDKHDNNNNNNSNNNSNNNGHTTAANMLMKRGSKREMKSFSKKDSSKKLKDDTTDKKPVKKATKWEDLKYTHGKAQQLDRSKQSSEEEQVEVFMQKYMPDTSAKTEIDKYGPEDDDNSEEDDDDDYNADNYKVQKKEPKKGLIGSFFSNLTSGRIIEKDDLKSVMDKFRESLIAKNVAAEIADKICDSVMENLEGKKIGAFTTLASEITKALEETMTRILTPKRNIDVLRDIMDAREQNRPYVITFCGVNGVGKSTSLSKICFWLLQNNFTCLIAACDTFRSGAVEQLEVHAKCLKVPVFKRGYDKDISIVAKEAISEARKKNYDVVLIDTAGRMQDNEELMKPLIKLIQLNKPDLVLFVGEALVGNDGVDQLMKFNDSLKNIAMGENIANHTSLRENLIDGIVLTKFDTIDDKVGAAISMVYKTGHPIVFIGVGQTYTDLKKLSIQSVVKSLLK